VAVEKNAAHKMDRQDYYSKKQQAEEVRSIVSKAADKSRSVRQVTC